MKFARLVFLIAGVYGLIVLLPLYFLEQRTGRDFPPAITHPEYYYSFIGVGLAWQIAFLILSRAPLRYRAMMIPSILEKASYAIAVAVLYLQQRVPSFTLGTAIVDSILGVLFIVAYVKTAKEAAQLCLKSSKSFLDRVGTGSGSDLVSDRHAIFPNDSESAV